MSHIPIIPLNNTLNIECPQVMTEEQDCILSVVPDSSYSHNIPLLLGTNVLNSLMEQCKAKYRIVFQRAKLFIPWYLAFRCMLLREKDLVKQNDTWYS